MVGIILLVGFILSVCLIISASILMLHYTYHQWSSFIWYHQYIKWPLFSCMCRLEYYTAISIFGRIIFGKYHFQIQSPNYNTWGRKNPAPLVNAPLVRDLKYYRFHCYYFMSSVWYMPVTCTTKFNLTLHIYVISGLDLISNIFHT